LCYSFKLNEHLIECGWVLQNYRQIDLSAGLGIDVREYPVDNGEADNLLFVDGKPARVIEAKKEGTILTEVHDQSYRYATGRLKWFINYALLPFIYESTGKETHFADYRDTKPRSREIFAFHRPESLWEYLKQNDTIRGRLHNLPTLQMKNLRDCQFNAITELDRSFMEAKPKALIQIATGSGKTFTVISSIYRLLRFAGAKRILFPRRYKKSWQTGVSQVQEYIQRQTLTSQCAYTFICYLMRHKDYRTNLNHYRIQHIDKLREVIDSK
jgi:type I restriction enzyme R subunit